MKVQNSASRKYAKDTLLGHIRRKEEELRSLQTLLKVIPWNKITEEDEQFLWGYFCRRDT